MRRRKFRINLNSLFVIFIGFIIALTSSVFRSCKFKENHKIVQSESSIKVLFTRYDEIIENIKFYIDNAKNSIYLAVFEIGNEEIAKSLINAKKRGIDVKVITDEKNSHYKASREIIENNIEVVFQNEESYMHHKFAVIDSEVVITGSMNWTDNDIFLNDNNVVIIRSKLLANNYLKEFEQMFKYKKFSKRKEKIGNNIIIIDNLRIENYFSPQDKPSKRIIEIINSSKKTIDFMAFSFTHAKIAKSIILAYERGVKVSGLFEKRQISKFSEYEKFKNLKMNVYIDKNPKNMHNKVIIIDSSIVITGSYNFSFNADNDNDENILIIFSKEIALKYLNYLNRLIQ